MKWQFEHNHLQFPPTEAELNVCLINDPHTTLPDSFYAVSQREVQALHGEQEALGENTKMRQKNQFHWLNSNLCMHEYMYL